MANVKIIEIEKTGDVGNHIATIVEFALDNNFINIIERKEITTGNLLECNSMLPKINEPGLYYKDLTSVFVRIKVKFEVCESDWYILEDDMTQQPLEYNYLQRLPLRLPIKLVGGEEVEYTHTSEQQFF